MLRKLFSAILIAAAALGAAAQGYPALAGNERVIGFAVTDDVYPQSACFGQAGTYSIGAFMEADRLRHYVGCRVLGMMIHVGGDAGRLRTWLYSYADGDLTNVNDQKQKLTQGWNRVDFNGNGYEIKEGEGLMFGYDYVETAEMAAAEEGYISFTFEGDTYSDGGCIIYIDDQVQTLSGIGALCVQLIIDASNMPEAALEFATTITVPHYRKKTDIFEAMATLQNVGRDRVTSVTFGYQFDDQAPVYCDSVVNIPSGGSYLWAPTKISMEHLAVGAHAARLFVHKINGIVVEPDEYNQYTDYIAIYENASPRQAGLVEGYPDQTSTASIDLYNRLGLAGDYDGKICKVNIYKPGGSLECNASADLHDWYAVYGEYSFASNRCADMGERAVAIDLSGLNSLPGDFGTEVFKDMLEEDSYAMAFGTLDIQRLYKGSDNSVDITVNATDLAEAAAICGDLALHIVLTEDNVTASQAVVGLGGRPMDRPTYIHDYVARYFHGGAKGTRLDVEGDHASLSVNIPLQEGWKPYDMKVVAYLTKWAGDTDGAPDPLKIHDVIQCAWQPVGDPAGIDEVSADDAAVQGPSEFYTIGGVKVSVTNQAPGIYIERRADGTTRKVIVK